MVETIQTYILMHKDIPVDDRAADVAEDVAYSGEEMDTLSGLKEQFGQKD